MVTTFTKVVVRTGAVALAFAAWPTGARAQRASASAVPGLAAVDSLTSAEFARDSIGSITVGVVSGADLVWTGSRGFADMAERRPATRETVYRIGSITKMFTALMFQQLAAAGTVRPADPVARYLPELARVNGLPAGAPPPTLLQLATMTGGLVREPRQEGPFWTGPVGAWEATTLSALPHIGYDRAPGAGYGYSNIGYAILGASLARAAGVPFVRWQQERILTPLGMRRTRFEVDPDIAEQVADGYAVSRDGRSDAAVAAREAREGRGYKVPNGALFTTVDDLARFVAFQLGRGPETVLPRARLDSVYRADAAAVPPTGSGYGTGFSVERRGASTWFGHGGSVAGYTASVLFDRDRQLGVIVLRSAAGGKANAGRLAEAALDRLVSARGATGR